MLKIFIVLRQWIVICRGFCGIFPISKMPADMMEKTSSSPVAATPASMNTTPDKPKTASEHRKVCIRLLLNNTHRLVPSKQKNKNISFSIPSEDFAFTHETRQRNVTVPVILGFFFSLVVQANYGKEEKSQNQREFGAAENSHPGCAQKRCKYSLIALVMDRFHPFSCQKERK